MSATHVHDFTPTATPKLYLAFELGWTSWNLAFTTAIAQKPRLRTIRARDLDGLQREIRRAKVRFNLPDDTPVVSCYEAGRDGFWIHRYVTHVNIANIVVDAASIEVNRRARRAKSDRLDVAKLLTMLIRYHGGEYKLWSVVHVPTVEDEDRRQGHRELIAIKNERTEHTNRIKGLLANLGLDIVVDAQLCKRLDNLRQWDGKPVPTELRARILREFERWVLCDRQVRELELAQRRRSVATKRSTSTRSARCSRSRRSGRSARPSSSANSSAGDRSRIAASWRASLAWHRLRMPAATANASRGSAKRATAGCGGWRWRSPGCGCAGNPKAH